MADDELQPASRLEALNRLADRIDTFTSSEIGEILAGDTSEFDHILERCQRLGIEPGDARLRSSDITFTRRQGLPRDDAEAARLPRVVLQIVLNERLAPLKSALRRAIDRQAEIVEQFREPGAILDERGILLSQLFAAYQDDRSSFTVLLHPTETIVLHPGLPLGRMNGVERSHLDALITEGQLTVSGRTATTVLLTIPSAVARDLIQGKIDSGQPPPSPLPLSVAALTLVVSGVEKFQQTITAATADITITTHDREGLIRLLAPFGIDQAAVDELDAEAERDDPAPSSGGFGPRVRSWMGQRVIAGLDGAIQAGVVASGPEALGLFEKALNKYFGSG